MHFISNYSLFKPLKSQQWTCQVFKCSATLSTIVSSQIFVTCTCVMSGCLTLKALQISVTYSWHLMLSPISLCHILNVFHAVSFLSASTLTSGHVLLPWSRKINIWSPTIWLKVWHSSKAPAVRVGWKALISVWGPVCSWKVAPAF